MTYVTSSGTVVALLVAAVGLHPVVAAAEPATAPERPASRSTYGHTAAADGVLRRGCHTYRYRYAVTTPTRDWTLETFLVDRTGQTVASGAYSVGSDPMRDRRATFRFCRYSTYAGRFTIRAKVHWYDDEGDHKAWFRPSHFWLRRR